MCNKALNWAWTLPLPTDAQCLIASYADMANKAGDCWPGLRLSQQRTGVKRDRITLLNRALVAAGLLTIIPGKPGKPGSVRSSHTYHLNVGKKLAEPLKIPARRRGRWPPTDPVGCSANPAPTQNSFRDQGGPHVGGGGGPHVGSHNLHLTSINPNSTVLTDSGRTRSARAAHAGKNNVWPTWQMKGYAQRLGLDWEAVLDRVETETRDLDMPWPPDDEPDWTRRWYATCQAEAAGYDGWVAAGMDDICWRAEHPEEEAG